MAKVVYMTRQQMLEEKEQELKKARMALVNYISMNVSEDTISDQEGIVEKRKQELKEWKGVV